MTVRALFSIAVCLFTLPVRAAQRPIPFPNIPRCERFLSEMDWEEGREHERRLSKSLGSPESWSHFVTSPLITNAALEAIGVPDGALGEFDYLIVKQWRRPASSLSGAANTLRVYVVGIDHGEIREKFLTGLDLINSRSAAWVPHAEGSEYEVGFVWTRQQDVRVYLSAIGRTDDISGVAGRGGVENEREARRVVQYTLGLDTDCSRASEFSSGSGFERIRTRKGLRCRIPVLRFYGYKGFPGAPQDAPSFARR